jgi:hypothetical protein
MLAAMRVKNTLDFLASLSVRAGDVTAFESLIRGLTSFGNCCLTHRPSFTFTDRTTRGGDVKTKTLNTRKRLRDESEGTEEQHREEGTTPVVWEKVLEDFQKRLSLRPTVSQIKGQKSALCLESEHIPLLLVSLSFSSL